MTRGAENYRRECAHALSEMPWPRRQIARLVDWRTIRREGGWL